MLIWPSLVALCSWLLLALGLRIDIDKRIYVQKARVAFALGQEAFGNFLVGYVEYHVRV